MASSCVSRFFNFCRCWASCISAFSALFNIIYLFWLNKQWNTDSDCRTRLDKNRKLNLRPISELVGATFWTKLNKRVTSLFLIHPSNGKMWITMTVLMLKTSRAIWNLKTTPTKLSKTKKASCGLLVGIRTVNLELGQLVTAMHHRVFRDSILSKVWVVGPTTQC